MKLPFKSIQWRLQLWHGALLLIVLLAFGLKSYSLVRNNRFDAIDRGLRRQSILVAATLSDAKYHSLAANAINEALSRQYLSESSLNPDEPDREVVRQVIQKAIVERLQSMNPVSQNRVNVEVSNLLASSERAGFYYVVWQPNGTVLLSSTNLPRSLAKPAIDKSPMFHARTGGGVREQFITASDGTQLLVGCFIAADLASLNHLALGLSITGGVIMAFGLLGGWWMSRRTIRPIKAISAAASKIASGNLAERINLSETDSELGQLAEVLNASFDQVQKAINQLQSALDRQIQFTADASHELRTPISVILAEANSALARERSAGEYREGFAACRQAARRMRRLTESLLALARLHSGEQPGKRERCNLQLVAGEAVDLLRPLAGGRGIALQCELAAAVCLGDADQLGQVVTNLVSNAIQYNRPGGSVCVRVSSDGHTSALSVTDTGVGIAPADLPYVFDRFYRADKARSQADGHVGLGLAITKAIVEAHGGTINAYSELGSGSTFTVGFGCPEVAVESMPDERNRESQSIT